MVHSWTLQSQARLAPQRVLQSAIAPPTLVRPDSWAAAKSAAIFNSPPNWVIGVEADASWANPQGGGDGSQQMEGAALIGTLSGITTSVALMESLPRELISLRLQQAGSVTPSVVWAKEWFMPREAPPGRATSINSLAKSRPLPAVQCRSFHSPRNVCLQIRRSSRPFNFAASETRLGWTIGAGIEWAVWENWSVKLEYDYLDFGSSTVTFNDPVLGAAAISVSQRISEVKLGVNYRFGSPLPTY